jgi:hypothetical protein
MLLFNFVDGEGNLFNFPNRAYGKALQEIIEKNVEGDDHLIVCSAGSNKGDNYLGIVYRIDVKDKNDKSLLLSMILKTAPQVEARRVEFHAHASFQREIIFYDEVFPLYLKFQKEKGIDVEKDGFNNVAHCYKVIDDEPCEGLFFDNLRARGYSMFNRLDDLTKDYAILTMKTLGRLHALFYSIKDQKPELIKKFQGMDDVMVSLCSEIGTSVRVMLDAQNKVAQNIVKKSENEDFKKRVLDFLSRDVADEFRAVVHGKLAEPYTVLCHGDCWNNNIMYLKDEV